MDLEPEMSGEPSPDLSRLGRADGVMLAGALIASWIVHAPALDSSFRTDDFVFLFQAANLPLVDFVFTPFAGHLLMVRNALFAGAFASFGLAPKPYFVLALVSHALNVALLFYVVRGFTGRAWAACLTSALWGMAPIQQGTINWVSQYGGLLATTFILVVLADLARHATNGRPPSVAAGLFWAAMLVSAATSYGSGIVAALLLGPLAWLCMPAVCGRLRTAALLAACVPPLLAVFARFSGGGSFGQALSAPPLATIEAFVKSLGYGVGVFWLGPWGTLVDGRVVMGPLAGASLHRAIVAVCLLSIPLFALLGLVFVSAGALARRRLLGFAALAAGSYAAIALARTALTLSFGGSVDSVVCTYRYHYFATAPIAVCAGLALVELENLSSRLCGSRAWRRWRPPAVRSGIAVALLVTLAVLTPFYKRGANRVDSRVVEISRARLRASLERLDRQLERRVPGKPLYVENDPSRDLLLLPAWLYPRPLFPGLVAVYAFAYPREPGDSESVLFVERDVELVKLLRANARARISRLLVTPDEAAAAAAEAAHAAEPRADVPPGGDAARDAFHGGDP